MVKIKLHMDPPQLLIIVSFCSRPHCMCHLSDQLRNACDTTWDKNPLSNIFWLDLQCRFNTRWPDSTSLVVPDSTLGGEASVFYQDVKIDATVIDRCKDTRHILSV